MADPQIDRAHAKAKSQTWTVEKISSQLDSIPQFDHRFWQHCSSIKDELVPILLDAMQNRKSIERLNASLLLLHLDNSEGTDGIVASLRDTNESLQEKTLFRLSMLPPEPFLFARNSPFPPPQPVPLKKDLLTAELIPFLTHPNSYFVTLTLRAITSMNSEDIELHIQPLLKHPSRDVRVGALYWYASRSDSMSAMPFANDLLFEPNMQPADSSAVVQALTMYCRGINDMLAANAAELLARFIISYVDYPGNDMSNIISNAMDGLKEAHYIKENQIAWAVFQSREKDWRRGIALRRLAELEGKSHIELLKASLSDRTLRQFAAQGISGFSWDSGDASLAEALLSALRKENRETVIRDLVSALIKVQGQSLLPFGELSQTLPPFDAMRIHWLLNKIDPKSAAHLLVEAKIIDSPSKDCLLHIRKKWDENHSASSVIFSLLDQSGRLLWFDCETSMSPVDYLGLIEELINIGHGVFTAKFFSQQLDESTNETEIQFVSGDEVHAFKTQDYGDWYDVKSVLDGLNGVLKKQNKSERFFLLYTGDQTCAVTFASESDFRRIADNLHLPIEGNYQAAMNAGIAYERHVVSKLSEE